MSRGVSDSAEMHGIGAWLRRRNEDAKAEVRAIPAEVASIAEHTVTDTRHVAANARHNVRSAGELATATLAMLAELERTAELVERIPAHTRIRLAGETPDGATRIVSLDDPDSRPIAKRRLDPSSSAARLRSSTTSTVSWWVTACMSATCRVRRCSFPPSRG